MLPFWLDLNALQLIPFVVMGATLFLVPSAGVGGRP